MADAATIDHVFDAGIAHPAVRTPIFRGLSTRLLGVVLNYLPGRSDLHRSTGLHPDDLEVLRPCCAVWRDAIDSLPERRIITAFRSFSASAAVAGSNVEKIGLRLSEVLVTAQHSHEVAASWSPCIHPWRKMSDRDQEVQERLRPFRVAAKFLSFSSFSGSSANDRDDSAHGNSFVARIPLLCAGSGASDRVPDVWLCVHWLDEGAYSARYQEHSMDSAGDVWLQAVQEQESAFSLATFKTAASRLGLTVSGDRRGCTNPLPVWRAERTFHCEETAGLKGSFFERLAAYLGLPDITPPDDLYVPPPASAWPGMLWLSMVLGDGASLWEWYIEEKEADATTVPDIGEAFELPAPDVDNEESKFINALDPLVKQVCDAQKCAFVVNSLKCATVERQLRQPATASRLATACKTLNVTPAATAFLTRNSRLVHFEGADFQSRHDYCSVHSACATLQLPLGQEGVVELRTSCSSGCGYERDDKEATVELRLCGRFALKALKGQAVPTDKWLRVVCWGPDARAGRRGYAELNEEEEEEEEEPEEENEEEEAADENEDGGEEEEGDGNEDEDEGNGRGADPEDGARKRRREDEAGAAAASTVHPVLEAVAAHLLPADSDESRISVGQQLARFVLTHAVCAGGDAKYAVDTVRSFVPGLCS